MSLKKKFFSNDNEHNQVVQKDLCKHIYIISTTIILEMGGNSLDMLNQRN